eukprot:1108562-Prorocentrum_minimum.AAC.2
MAGAAARLGRPAPTPTSPRQYRSVSAVTSARRRPSGTLAAQNCGGDSRTTRPQGYRVNFFDYYR